MPDHNDSGYKSATDFGGKNLTPAMGKPMMHPTRSKGVLSAKRGPSIGKRGSGSNSRPGLPGLPTIDHSKQMDKLRSITGRSEDFGATSTSNDSVHFSKPKIGVR